MNVLRDKALTIWGDAAHVVYLGLEQVFLHLSFGFMGGAPRLMIVSVLAGFRPALRH